MRRSQQRLFSQLATSDNELASGLGQCLEPLRLISLPRASPVFVLSHRPHQSIWQRTLLPRPPPRTSTVPLPRSTHSSPHQTVITLIKTPDPIYVTTALFFREDGMINPTVLVDEESWKEPAPYVHTLHVEDDFERPSVSPNFLCHSYRDIVLGPTMNGPPPSSSLGTALSLSLSGKG